jgi:hypothetical protein
MDDSDLTGTWIIESDELALHNSEKTNRLTIDIFGEDYKLANVCDDDDDTDDEY